MDLIGFADHVIYGVGVVTCVLVAVGALAVLSGHVRFGVSKQETNGE